ncbi:MAG TPA: response regulator transcription factor [Clostridia bacterium]|nr:response regulator transcription factor [Clostridia bacterium]
MSNMRKSILAADSESKNIHRITSLLENSGFQVYPADNGQKALEIFKTKKISLAILDLMLPGIPGADVCCAIRNYSNIPIIMLTTQAAEDDILESFRLGADDFLKKPFARKELLARITAVLRRTEHTRVPFSMIRSYNNGDLIIDFEQKIVKKNLTPVELTRCEYRLLVHLVSHPGKAFTREELIEIAFDYSTSERDRRIDCHIKNLRQKIEEDHNIPRYILTARGFGYKFAVCAQDDSGSEPTIELKND